MVALKEFANFIIAHMADLISTFDRMLADAAPEYAMLPSDVRLSTSRKLLKAVLEAYQQQTYDPLLKFFQASENRWPVRISDNPLIEIEILGQTLTPVVTNLEAGKFLWQLLYAARSQVERQPASAALATPAPGDDSRAMPASAPTDEVRSTKAAQELETVAQISTVISSLVDVDELLQTVVKLTKERFGLYHARIYMFDETSKKLTLIAAADEAGQELVAQGEEIELDHPDSVVARTARSRQGVIVNDLLQLSSFVPHPFLPNTQAEMAIPMIVGEQLIGVLDVLADVTNRFTEQDVQIKTTLASQVAVALNNARNYQRMQTALEEAGVFRQLVEVAGQGIGLANMDGTVAYLNPVMINILGAESLESERGLTLARYYTPENQNYVFNEMLPQAMEKGEWSGEISFVKPDGTEVPTIQSVSVVRDEAGNPIYLANSVVDISERKQIEETLAKRATELATVSEVSIQAAAALNPAQLLQDLVDLTKERFDLYHAHIYLLNPGGNALELAAGAGDAGRQMVAQGWSIPFEQEHSLVAQAAQQRQGVIVNDVRQNPDFLPNPLLPDTRSEMAIPMIVSERVLGVLDVQSDRVDRFTDEDVQIKTILASQVAITLDNARLLEQTQRRAQREQAIREMTDKLRAAPNLERLVEIATEELGEWLTATYTRLDLGIEKTAGNGHHS